MESTLEKSVAPYQLQATLPQAWALKWHHAATTALFVLIYLYFCYLPLSDPRVWHEVAAGQLAQLSADQVTSRLPLSEGMSSVEWGWLGPRIIAQLYSGFGLAGLAGGFACFGTASLLAWYGALRRLDPSWRSALLCLGILASWRFEFTGLTSLTLASGCFAATMWLALGCYDRKTRTIQLTQANWPTWLGMLACLAFWSHVHSSVLIGLTWLLVLALARAADYVLAQRQLSFWRDREFQVRIWTWELAVGLSLLHPGTLAWWQNAGSNLAVAFSSLQATLQGEQALVLASWSGACFALGWICWYRASQRLSTSTLWSLWPGLLSVIVAFQSQHMGWFALGISLSLAAAWGSQGGTVQALSVPATTAEAANGPATKLGHSWRFAFTLLTGLILWIGICLSPWAALWQGRPAYTPEQLTHRLPRQASEFLRTLPADSLTYSPVYWSDYLLVTTHLPYFSNFDRSQFPAMVWQDRERIFRGSGNWNDLAQKYGLSALVLDKQRQPELIHQLRQGGNPWKIVYEDSVALVARAQRALP